MDEELQQLLKARPTSEGAFSGGQIPLGFDANAVLQYAQGINQPNAAPVVLQQEAIQQPTVTQAFDDPVYTPNWSLDTPPVVVRIPEGFNPSNPSHAAAAQQAYQTAYDEKALGEAALEFLANADAKKAQIKSANDAVARYSRDVQRLEAQRKIGKSEIPTQDGMVVLPMGAKETAKNLTDLGAAKQGLAQAEKTLATANEPVRPKIIQVQLPAEQAQQPEQTTAGKELLPEAKPEVPAAPKISQQRQRYDAIKNSLYQQAQQMVQAGKNPKVVQEGLKGAMDRLDSQWKPELVEVEGVLYSYGSPSKVEVVRDNVQLVKEPFNDIIGRVRKNIENIDQIESMRQMAERAAKLAKGTERTAIIEALRASLKSINTAISGTSDALSQNEYLRLGGSLETWNFIKAMQPDSAALFFSANPEGFAKSVEVLRNMTGNRMVSNFNQAEKISKKFPVLETLLPDKPSYYNEILKTYGKSQIIEKNRTQQQQVAPIITKGGTGFTIQKR